MATLNEPQHSALSRYDLAWDKWMARAYSLNWEVVAYLVIFLLAVSTRFYHLGDRVMSHDESLHTYYSWRLYDSGDFQHTPLMHGPVLFHAVAFFYFLFGDNDFTARIYAAVLGISMVMFPYLWRRWLGRTGALLASVGLLISPMILYYNRYIREDTPNMFFLLVMLHALFMYLDGEKPRRPFWIALFGGAMLLMFASKETAFMYFMVILTFLGFYWLLRLSQEAPFKLKSRPAYDDDTWMPPLGQSLLGHGLVLGAALVLGFLLSYVLYYWQFAKMDWWWVAIGVALTLLVRLMPLAWDTINRAVRTNDPQDIINLVLIFVNVLGTILFLYGVFTYRANNAQLVNVEQGGVFVPSAAAQSLDDLDSARQTGLIVTVGGLLMMFFSLGGLLFTLVLAPLPSAEGEATQPNKAGMQWLITTAMVTLGVAFGLVCLRLLTQISFDYGNNLVRLACIAGMVVLFEAVGLVRTAWAGAPRPGIAQMFTEGLARPKSASMVIIAGTIIGGLLAVHAFGVLDIIKPEQVWRVIQPAVSEEVTDGGENFSPATPEVLEPTIQMDTHLGNGLLLWMALPIIVVMVLVLVIAIIKTPQSLPLPWADIMAVYLVATIVCGLLIFVERHTLEDTDATAGPVAVDPNQAADGATAAHHNELIIGSMIVLLGLSAFVLMWRMYYPEHWDFLRRQPVFDVLIVMGTLILPWFSAYPIWLAGYTLDAAPLPPDTVRVSILVTGSFLIFCTIVGLAWNWKVWLLTNAVFLALFVFFFTTVFTNGAGLFTGMVGSLGYWLEQQGVRRGSQPQYYYTLIQLPVYEFMPTILAGLAGIAGLVKLFEWRNQSLQAEAATALRDKFRAEDAETNPLDMRSLMEQQPTLDQVRATKPLPAITDEDLAESDTEDYETETSPVEPYDHAEELVKRETQLEWLGELPFLQFLGYWGIMILISLTVAGEKMPWLTTHIALPFILLGGWYAGRIIEKIDWNAIKSGGWALLVFLVPVFVVALLRVLGPLMGGTQPFQGQEQSQLGETNEWLAALIVVLGTGYFIYRLTREVGTVQTRRIAFASLFLMLGVITARAAVMAAYRNYDYPTEFLVYAHSGNAVKLTLSEIDYLANRTNEGFEMKVAYDDDSSWPMTWYMRHYNATFFAGESSQLESNPGVLEGARVIVVGNRKNDAVERILGENYYRFDYKRLWWPMQEYFNLTYDRVSRTFEGDNNPAAGLYRDAIWDIWWNRDYKEYGVAQCFESRELECDSDANPQMCYQRLENECGSDNRYDLTRWPVSDAMYVYVDKEIAAEIWDAGIGGENVASREPVNIVDRVYRDYNTLTIFGQDVGLSGPRGVAVDASGMVYVADTGNSRIMIFNPDGTLNRSFGEPSTQDNSSPGTLYQPWGVSVAQNGNIYVADTWNHRVQVFSPSGELINSWGQYGVLNDGAAGNYDLWGPRDIELDLAGNVMVADTGNKRVRVYSPDGVWIRDIGSGGSGKGQLDEPVGLAVNPVNGEIYVADTWNRRIEIFSPDGLALRSFDVPMWFDTRNLPDRPYLAVSPDGAFIAVSDMTSAGRNDGPRVVVYDLSGNAVMAFNAPETDFAAGLFGIRIVAGIAFAPDGSVYALDSETGRVLKFPALPLTSGILPVPINPPAENVQQPQVEVPNNGLGESLAPDANIPNSVDEPFADATQEATESSN